MKGAGGIVDAALRAYERFVLPRVFARATRHIAVSPVASNLRTGRATMIPPGVDTVAFAPPAHGARDARSCTSAGSRRRRGGRAWTSSWTRSRRCPDATLEFVGDGDLVPELRERARRLGVGTGCAGTARCRSHRSPTVLQHAGVLALPSLTESESFGMALIEAMAAGCPVVGSDVGGIPHVIRDGVDGLLVPPG